MHAGLSMKVQMSMKMKRQTDFIKIITTDGEQQYQGGVEFEIADDDDDEDGTKSQNFESGLKIIHDNMKGVLPENLIRPSVITWEEAYSIKLPRLRKANVHSTLNQLLAHEDDGGHHFNNPEFFFEEDFNSFN